ncbi:uncharacterized protein LOC132219148 isoform X5 [Myotis daubentonii]|uniref:uncharacterized protein LOC132219148 isoform X5 n=1 Tax=Myotis daubentonii TaxID=98922 RepID=UPI002872F3FA|nr:uncharacterized protein LOC132219148 isoform X5 [Myotis daubentonii]
MRRKGRMHAQLRAPGRLLLSRGAPLGPRRSFALTNSSPAAAPLRRPRRTQFQSRGRPSSCRLDGCPRKMRSRQPRRLGEEGVRRLPPAPPDENFRSERGVGDPGELGRRCVLRGNLLVDYTSAWFSGPEMSFVLGPARSGLTRRRPRFARM